MTTHFTVADHTVVLIPTVVVTRQTCENPKCRHVHGFSVEIAFLCFSINFDFDL